MNNRWFLFGIAFLLIGGIIVSAHAFGSENDTTDEDLQLESDDVRPGPGTCPYAEEKAETGECPGGCGGACGGSCGVSSCGCSA